MDELLRTSYFPEHLRSLYGYNNICRNSNEVLNFFPPRNLSVTILRCINPYLSTSCDLLMADDRSLKVALCSEPIFRLGSFPPTSSKLCDTWQTEVRVPRESRAHLLYGRLTENSGADVMYSCFLSPNTLFTVCGAGNLNRTAKSSSPFFAGTQFMLMNRWKHLNTYLSYYSKEHIVGASLITTVKNSKSLSLGGELYFSGSDLTGTISLGMRYVYDGMSTRLSDKYQNCVTLLINPVFGQLMSIFTCSPALGLFSCLSYNFNFYSYDADLNLGFEYTPTINKENNSSIKTEYFSKVKLRLGREIALSFIYYPIQKVRMEFGLFMNPFNSAMDRFGVAIQLH